MHASRHAMKQMRDTLKAYSGILAHLRYAICLAVPVGEHHVASMQLSMIVSEPTCGMIMLARLVRGIKKHAML